MLDFEVLRDKFPVVLHYDSTLADVLSSETTKEVDASLSKVLEAFLKIYRRGSQWSGAFGGYYGRLLCMNNICRMLDDKGSALIVTLNQIKDGGSSKLDGRAIFADLTSKTFRPGKPGSKDELMNFLWGAIDSNKDKGKYRPGFVDEVINRFKECSQTKSYELAAQATMFGGVASYFDFFQANLFEEVKGRFKAFAELGDLGNCNIVLKYLLSSEYKNACLALAKRQAPDCNDSFLGYIAHHYHFKI